MAERRKKLAIIDGKSVFYPDTKKLEVPQSDCRLLHSGFGAGQAGAGVEYAGA